MKNKIKEVNLLPYIFNHMEFLSTKKIKNKKNIQFLNSCGLYQTDFYSLEKPDKALVRFI